MDISKIIEDIQYVLAPAVMVSSAGLLLLGFQAKFSNIASRFRVLNQERRALMQKDPKTPREAARQKSLDAQVDYLLRRSGYVKNAVILVYTGIVCFTGSSILIFLNLYRFLNLWPLIVIAFLGGMLSLLLAALLMIQETRIISRAVAVERQS